MPRSSKPGERRGGRQRATPNKRTVLTERILAVASANPTASFDELVALLVKDKTLAADVRVAIARKWFAAARSRSAKGRTKKGHDRGLQATERTASTKSDRGVASTTPQPTIGASPDAGTATNSCDAAGPVWYRAGFSIDTGGAASSCVGAGAVLPAKKTDPEEVKTRQLPSRRVRFCCRSGFGEGIAGCDIGASLLAACQKESSLLTPWRRKLASCRLV